jgi:hypothetical protein
MLVAKKDGSCRECGGVLQITDADDATMSVECTECGETYLVEPDAFGDGCMTYYVEVMTRKEEGDYDE